jgi:hypothetical protein
LAEKTQTIHNKQKILQQSKRGAKMSVADTLYRRELILSFLGRLSEAFSKRLAVDDTWLQHALLGAEQLEEVERESLESVIARVEELVQGGRYSKIIAILGNELYEVRIYADLVRTGLSVISEGMIFSGIKAFEQYRNLVVSGEIDVI